MHLATDINTSCQECDARARVNTEPGAEESGGGPGLREQLWPVGFPSGWLYEDLASDLPVQSEFCFPNPDYARRLLLHDAELGSGNDAEYGQRPVSV